MPFQKSLKVTKTKIDNLIDKEKSLNDDLGKVSRKVEKRKNEVSSLLGKISLGENRTEDSKDLDSLKTLYEKAKEEYSDIQTMVSLVREERAKLAIEVDEAVLRESPQEMAAVASKFNQKLDNTLKTLSTLEADFSELQNMESEFVSLSNGRQKAMSRLGRVDTLELSESLGKLALTPSPHGYTFTTGLNLQTFTGNLLGYRVKLSGYEKFKQDNPNYFENLKVTREEMAKPFKIGDFLRPFEWSR